MILTLPYTMAQTGMLLGILLQLTYAVMASWTAYLMNTLYMEHVNRDERAKALAEHPGHPDDRSACLHHVSNTELPLHPLSFRLCNKVIPGPKLLLLLLLLLLNTLLTNTTNSNACHVHVHLTSCA